MHFLDALEITGFTIAVADFSGWSRRLENALNRARLAFLASIKRFPTNLIATAGDISRRVLFVAVALGLVIAIVRVYASMSGSHMIPLQDELLFVLAAAALIGFYEVAIVVFITLPIYVLLLILWLILHLMHLPRRGIVGTAGFVTALISFISRFM
jgi:hypothetical protein